MKVSMKCALSVDGKIDTARLEGAQLSSPAEWDRVERLRAACDAVMVGARTLQKEDPWLTIKPEERRANRALQGQPLHPIKAGIVSCANLPLKGRFLNDGPARVLIFTAAQAGREQTVQLQARGAEVFSMGDSRVDLEQGLIVYRS